MASLISDKTLRIYNTQDFSRTSCSTVVWSMDTGEIEAVLEHPGRNPVRVCAFSINRPAVNDTTVVACSFNPCGQMFVTESTYGDLRLWDLDMNQLHAEKNNHDLGVTCYCFGPKILSGGGGGVEFRPASCGQGRTLKVWTVSRSNTGCKMQLLHILTGRSAPVLSCAFSADEQLLFVKIKYVTPCAFAPSAPLIATVSMDKTVNIWRVEDGRSGHEILMCGHFLFSDQSGRKLPGHCRLLVSDWSEEEGLETLVENFKANNIDEAELSVGLHSMVLRKVGELKRGGVCTGVPDEFLCPITRELMRDPVIAAGGTRKRFESRITTKNRSSHMTNLPLRTPHLTPNRTLKMAIGRWRTSQ
uniref:WD repeat, sterile alpha motif and U-box domain containing 1 n=1 Tax=Oncorhynchus kisutch TaxID=8019 RepID=A0A8C7IVC6_ONCKI